MQKVNNIKVVGVSDAKRSSDILRYIDTHGCDYLNDILIFASDYEICKNRFSKSIAIQHGIAWDCNIPDAVSDIVNCHTIFKGAFRSIRKYIRFKKCKNIVCVDNNFINWYRTQVAHIDQNLYFIPNFANIALKRPVSDSKVSIIFARRLEKYRGTRLFTNALIEILRIHKDIEVTIAGTGPEEQWMRDRLSKFDNVSFITYKAADSSELHSQYSIAVVPSIVSEGTSLSLLEAMGAGCAAIATNVGGLTNTVLDGYNGLLISPEENELVIALGKLIEDKNLRERIGKNAQDTVACSFSFERWKQAWYRTLNAV